MDRSARSVWLRGRGWIALALILASPVLAQEPGTAPGKSDSRNSPRATMFTFLEAIHAVIGDDLSAWDQVIACLDLSKVGAEPDSEKAKRIAGHLWRALNRIREVKPEELPDADSMGAMNKFVYFPRALKPEDDAILKEAGTAGYSIELVKTTGGSWKFSADTVAGITKLFQALERLRSKVDVDEAQLEKNWIRQAVPESLTEKKLFDLEYWQWLGIFITILLGVVLDHSVRVVVRMFSRHVIIRRGASEHADAARAAALPVGLVVAAIVWIICLKTLDLPLVAENVLLGAARIFGILAGAWAAWRVADLAGEVLIEKAAQTETKIDDVLIPLLRKTFKIFVVAMGVIYGANTLNVEIMPLLASLGIGGVAFAFAAKDTVENFFGSVAVLLDRPFEVGDWVVIGSDEGTVEEIGFRSTRIRTFYNSQITVPNANLVRAVVDNYGRRQYRRWKTHIGVQYDTPPDKLVAFAEGIRELVRCHPFTRKDYFQVRMHQFGAHSLDLLLYIFHEVPDWSTELRERERMFIDIVRLADLLGVQFAFPTQTLHLYKEEHGSYQVLHDIPQRDTERGAETMGIRIAQQLVEDQPWQREKPGPVTFSGGPSELDETKGESERTT